MQLAYQNLLAHVRDGVYFTDLQRRITYWNEGAERITGYAAAEVLGRQCRDNILIHVDETGTCLCEGRCPLAAVIQDGTIRRSKVFLHHKQGHRVPVEIRVVPLTDADGRIVGAAEFFADNSMETAMQTRIKELEQLALLDPLTQLPNRHHIEPELTSRFHEMERMGLSFGILFMDIDHFKRFNDTYGHDVGDDILRTVSNTLKGFVRPFDLAGRWGGEEFLCIVRNVGRNQLLEIGNRLRMLISRSTITYEAHDLGVSVSIGATMAVPFDTRETLIKRADHLMYQSKQRGRDRVTLG